MYSEGWTTDTPFSEQIDFDTTKDLMSEDGFENEAESGHAGDHQDRQTEWRALHSTDQELTAVETNGRSGQ